MDNVILWIKSNREVVDVYKRTKHDCNYHHKSDSDFLLFLLEAATNVLSIVQHFGPRVAGTSSTVSPSTSTTAAAVAASDTSGDTTPVPDVPETIVTSEDEINLDKLDKQLRISIVCPDMETEQPQETPKGQPPPRAPSTTPPPPAPPLAPPPSAQETTPSPPPPPDAQDTTSSAALKDISDHVNELETVLESLSKGCPSPAAAGGDGARSQVVRSTRAYLDSLKSTPAQQVEMAALLKSHETALANYVKHSENVYLKQFESYAKQLKPHIPKRGPVAAVARNSGVRSSPNVTISAESQLNLALKDREVNKNPTIIKPIPMMAKSPEKATAEPPLQSHDCDTQIDVVSPQPGSPEPHGVKRKAECMEEGAATSPQTDHQEPGTTSPRRDEASQVKEETRVSETPPMTTPGFTTTTISSSSGEHMQLPPPMVLPPQPPPPIPIPSEAELTKQLMSVIQSTLAQSYTCQECGLIFPNELMLHGHMLAHLEQEEKTEQQFNCPTCAFKTPRRSTLTKHINTVHARDRTSGILYCDQCEYKTPTKSHLRNHMLAHSGNRQYQCPHCTYSSNFSNALTRHMTMHSRELFESKAAAETSAGTGASQG